MSYVTLTGTFTNLKTTLPSVGQLRFTMPFQMVNTATNTIVVPEDFSAVLDTNGQFTISLPCTDDPDFIPVNRYWSVTEMVDGHNRVYAIALPASPSTADLSDIAPVDPVDPGVVYTLFTPQAGYAQLAGAEFTGSVETHVPTGVAVEASGTLAMPATAHPAFYDYRLAAALDVTGGYNGVHGDTIDPTVPIPGTDNTYANAIALFYEHNGVGLLGRGAHHLYYGRAILGPNTDGAYGELGGMVLSVTNNRHGGLAECLEMSLTANQTGQNAVETAILLNNIAAAGGYWARGKWIVSGGTQPGTEGLYISGSGGWNNFVRFANAAGADVWRVDNTGKLFFIGGGTLEPQGADHKFSGVLVSAGLFATGTAAASQYQLASDTTRNIRWGIGTPEGNIVAGVASLYLRADGGAGTTLYVKESGSGNVGWIAK